MSFCESPNKLLYIIQECERYQNNLYIKIKEGRLDLFYFYFYFYFLFDLFFYFIFLEQLGLGLIGHAITSVT